MAEHLPDPAPDSWPQALAEDQVLVIDEKALLMRLYSSGGSHRTRWHEFRHWGPTAARFDHHPNGVAALHPDHGVWYGALESFDPRGRRTALGTVVAERFQDSRTLPLTDKATSLVVCHPGGPLTLLDLESSWLTTAGGNAAIESGSRAQSRKWARAIRATYPKIDGLVWRSSVFRPGRAVVLWDCPRSALAKSAELNRVIGDITSVLLPVAREIGYQVSLH